MKTSNENITPLLPLDTLGYYSDVNSNVLDHCKGIDIVYHNGKKGETYNIGGRNERTNLQIVDRICTILDEIKPRHPDTETSSA